MFGKVLSLICIETVLWLDILLNKFLQKNFWNTVSLAMFTSHDSNLVSVSLMLVRNKLTQIGFSYNCFDPLENYIHHLALHNIYYMASSVSGQDVPNRALWLATRAGKMELSCPGARDSSLYPAKKFAESLFTNPLLTKPLVRPRWLDISLVLLLRVSSRSINTQK